MAYHLELVASPPRPILWNELSQAGKALGWTVHDREQELRLESDGATVARIVLAEGEPSIRSPDDAAMFAFIAIALHMGLRVRGDDFESYRSLTETYIHPDDEPARARATAPPAVDPRRAGRQKVTGIARVATLVLVFVGFAAIAWMDRP